MRPETQSDGINNFCPFQHFKLQDSKQYNRWWWGETHCEFDGLLRGHTDELRNQTCGEHEC